MQIGDVVEIMGGPFAGLQGRLKTSDARRVLVVIQIHGRQFDLEMDLDWVLEATRVNAAV